MADRFLQRDSSVDCIICSPANRAKTTAKLFAKNIGYPADEIVSNPELYFAGMGMFLKAASLVDDDYQSAMLVGHNPAITEFSNEMSGEYIDNIPTCGLVQLRVDIDHWGDIDFDSAEIVVFDYPKKKV